MKVIVLLCLVLFSTIVFAEKPVRNLEIVELGEGVFQHTSYRYIEEYGLVGSNGLVVIEKKKAYIIDTPWGDEDTQKLLDWIKSQGYTPEASVSTHSHEDRTAGIGLLNTRSIATYTSQSTFDVLKGQGRELPTNTFSKQQYTLVPEAIEVYYAGAGHTSDNVVVWLPKHKILFGGCLVRSLGSKGLGYVGEASILEWPGSIRKVMEKYPDAERVVPGHGEVGDYTLLAHTEKLAIAASQQHSN